MRKVLIVASLALLLSACSSTSGPPLGETTEPPAPNAEACEDFAALTHKIAEPFEVDKVLEPWEALRVEFDTVSLKAEGDVKARIETLVKQWPDVGKMVVYRTGQKVMNDNIKSVARACEADGAKITYSTYAD